MAWRLLCVYCCDHCMQLTEGDRHEQNLTIFSHFDNVLKVENMLVVTSTHRIVGYLCRSLTFSGKLVGYFDIPHNSFKTVWYCGNVKVKLLRSLHISNILSRWNCIARLDTRYRNRSKGGMTINHGRIARNWRKTPKTSRWSTIAMPRNRNVYQNFAGNYHPAKIILPLWNIDWAHLLISRCVGEKNRWSKNLEQKCQQLTGHRKRFRSPRHHVPGDGHEKIQEIVIIGCSARICHGLPERGVVLDIGAHCKQTYHITTTMMFWRHLYLRYYDANVELPVRLQKDCMARPGGIRACTIRSLFYTYPLLVDRLHPNYYQNTDGLLNRQLMHYWYRQIGHTKFQFFFKFKRRLVDGSRPYQSDQLQRQDHKSMASLRDVYANSEEGCSLLIVSSRRAENVSLECHKR